jgi:hypothetical protein
VDIAGVKPGVKRKHLIDLFVGAAACKAVYAGSIPTPASQNQLLASFMHRQGCREWPRVVLATQEIDLDTRHIGLFAATRVRYEPFDAMFFWSGSVPESEINLGPCLPNR